MSPLQVWLGGLVKKSPKTQRELADEAGITEKHLSQMLTGKAEGSLSVWSRVLAAADQLHVTDPAPDELTALRADLVVQQKQNKELDAERDALRERIRALADRWEARAPDMHDDARDILLNHAAAIRTAIEPEFVPLPEQHICDDYCQTCKEPGDA